MQEIRDLSDARDFILSEYGGELIDQCANQLCIAGYIFKINDFYFFMRFDGRPEITFERLEIESQIKGLKAGGRNLKNVWCLVVRPNREIYVIHPAKVREFINRFKPSGDEWVIPLSMMDKMEEWFEDRYAKC